METRANIYLRKSYRRRRSGLSCSFVISFEFAEVFDLFILYTMKNRDDLGPMAGGATVAATPLIARGALTYLFTLYDIIVFNQLIGEKLNELHSGDSYTQTEFAVDGTQPSTTNPMGNPTLGEYYTTEQVGLRYSQFQIGTGTTSGGTNWVGYLTTLYNASPVLNYNFAVGGATIDNSIVDTKVKDVTSQVRDFELAYGKKPISAPWSSDNAVFGFWIGINEYRSSVHRCLLCSNVSNM